jgi:hypothetical protein
VIVGPLQDGIRGQLGAVVTDDPLGLAALAQEPIELASDPDPRDRGVGDERQALARAIVDHDEDAQAAAVDELVGSEVERPAVIRALLISSMTASYMARSASRAGIIDCVDWLLGECWWSRSAPAAPFRSWAAYAARGIQQICGRQERLVALVARQLS